MFFGGVIEMSVFFEIGCLKVAVGLGLGKGVFMLKMGEILCISIFFINFA